MMSRSIVALVILAVCLGPLALRADATTPSLALSTAVTRPNATVTLTASGFAAIHCRQETHTVVYYVQVPIYDASGTVIGYDITVRTQTEVRTVCESNSLAITLGTQAVATVPVPGSGTVTTSFTVPNIGSGSYEVVVADRSGTRLTAPLVVDGTPPIVIATAMPAPLASGWHDGAVTVSFSCFDAHTTVQCPAPITVASEGADQSVSGTATDGAGNTATATVVLDIDLTWPTIQMIASRPPDRGSWYTAPFSLDFTCADAVSGVLACPADATFSADGAGILVGGDVADNAGHRMTQLWTVNLDQAAPTITGARTPAASASGWSNTSVTVSFDCRDATSGIASCTAPVTLSADGTGQSVSGTAVDRAGHTASATVGGIDIDRTAPQIAFAGNQGTYLVDQHVAITCAASDALSGLASSTCPGASGPAYAFVGATTLVATATDRAGNTATATAAFRVDVTADGLCALTHRYVSQHAIANALCAKLDAAAAAHARGNGDAARGALGAFAQQVSAQRGKAIAPADADRLDALSAALGY